MIPFVTGPLLWFSCVFFAAGCLVRLASTYWTLFPERRGRMSKQQHEADVWQAPSARKGSEAASDPVPLSLPLWCLVLLVMGFPLFYQGHAELLSLRWQISWPAFSYLYSDILGIAALAVTVLAALGIVALPNNSGSRRTTLFALLLLCALPFFSGLMTRYRMPGYDSWLIAHILFGEAFLIAIPCSGLFTILFFFLPPPRAKESAETL